MAITGAVKIVYRLPCDISFLKYPDEGLLRSKKMRNKMLKTEDDILYSTFSDYIHPNEVRQAFFILVGAAAASSKYTCGPVEKGVIKDFRFYSSPRTQPFAFIINQGSLLFYLRTPAVESGKWTLADLVNSFSTVNENRRGEWTIKIQDRVEAIKVVEGILNA